MIATYQLTNSNWGELDYFVRGLKRRGFQSVPLRSAHTRDGRDIFVYHMYQGSKRELFLTFNARSTTNQCNLYIRCAYDDGFDKTLKSILDNRVMKIELLSRE